MLNYGSTLKILKRLFAGTFLIRGRQGKGLILNSYRCWYGVFRRWNVAILKEHLCFLTSLLKRQIQPSRVLLADTSQVRNHCWLYGFEAMNFLLLRRLSLLRLLFECQVRRAGEASLGRRAIPFSSYLCYGLYNWLVSFAVVALRRSVVTFKWSTYNRLGLSACSFDSHSNLTLQKGVLKRYVMFLFYFRLRDVLHFKRRLSRFLGIWIGFKFGLWRDTAHLRWRIFDELR